MNLVVIDYDKFGQVLRCLLPRNKVHELCMALSENEVFYGFVDELVDDDGVIITCEGEV